jgi:hypothetical protein
MEWKICPGGNDLHRSIKDSSHTATRPGTVFYSERHAVLTQVLMKIMSCRLVKGYGCFGGTQCLHLGLLALKMNVNWPVDRPKRPDDLNLNQHHCENFTTTNCCSETSAKNYQSMLRKIPTERRCHLHCVQSLKPHNCGIVTFCAISMPREWQGVFFVVLFTCAAVRKLFHSR